MREEKNTISIQNLLSLGYVFLIFLGLIKDVIYYNFFLGINIVEYSTLFDILVSPIVYLTESVYLVIGVVLLFFAIRWWINNPNYFHKKLKNKSWYIKNNDIEALDKKYAQKKSLFKILPVIAMLIVSFYLGSGLGAGHKMKVKIEEQKLISDHNLIFFDKSEIAIKKLGQNSLYVFFIEEGKNIISIAPISGNIHRIDKIEKKN